MGCGTCKKARAWLAARAVEIALVDVAAPPPSRAVLEGLWKRSGAPLRKFFNVSGESYRAGGFKDRVGAMSEAEMLAALASDGKLVKRPVLDLGARVLVGFDATAWEAAFA
jgi:arsenate reductase